MTNNEVMSKYNKYLNKIQEIGFVEKSIHPICYVKGLPSATTDEVVYFENDDMGQVLSISNDYVEVLVFSKFSPRVGSKVVRTAENLYATVSFKLLGATIDALGNSIYSTKPVIHEKPSFIDLFASAPGINYRSEIKTPFITGVSVVDMMIPLGKGQRELVIGDRNTGKTNFVLQSILTQASQGTICVYTSIGKKKADIIALDKFFEHAGVKDKIVHVSSSSSSSLGMIYLTPYYAMSIAEYFRDNEKEVLIIFDDLTTHAKFYREMSLIARRFPGRSSYPSDIFYSHASLLERAGNFIIKKSKDKEVSITCLPIAETVEGDISGYIQTNLMSITDGHIFFDKEMFSQGQRPAVNYFLSVTRVGRQTQSVIRWGINRELNSFLGLYEKTKRFVHFGAELNEGIKSTLNMGSRILCFFNQGMSEVLDNNLQMFLFCMIWVGTWNTVSNEEMMKALDVLKYRYENDNSYKQKVLELISSSSDFNNMLGKISMSNKDFL